MTTEVWDRGFRIDSRHAACEFLESIWNEERQAPVRIHERGPQPRDLSGSPKWSSAFNQYIFASPNEVQTVRTTDRGVVDERHYYRYPLWRALQLIGRRDHDRWTKDVPRRPFHPRPENVLHAMAAAAFEPRRVRLVYGDGTAVSDEMADLFCIGAVRKIRGLYQEEYIEWTARSESDRNAVVDGETAA
jgi:hypothetical protein